MFQLRVLAGEDLGLSGELIARRGRPARAARRENEKRRRSQEPSRHDDGNIGESLVDDVLANHFSVRGLSTISCFAKARATAVTLPQMDGRVFGGPAGDFETARAS